MRFFSIYIVAKLFTVLSLGLLYYSTPNVAFKVKLYH